MNEDIPIALDYETRSTNNASGPRKGNMFIILGRTGMSDYENSIEHFQETQTRDRRSPHFVIGREPKRLAKMAEAGKAAWHAGTDSRWKTFTNLNKLSVGIFLCGVAGEGYTDYQYETLNQLIPNQMKNAIHNHNPEIVLSHQDVRPWRHWGVGPEFEWYRLIQKQNAAAWKPVKDANTPWDALHEYGYRGSKRAIIEAFQTRFMASTITGAMDTLTENFIMGRP